MAFLRNIISIIGMALVLLACQKTDETATDPKLIGRWTDRNVRYYFRTDRSYAQKFLRKGAANDTVLTDSAYGTYTLDITNNTVSFLMTGYKLKSGTIVGSNINAGVWNYSIKDTVLTYTSLTSNGRLVRF